MPFVVLDQCRDTKDRSCVEVCPVDCIYEAVDQLRIHPGECIDCAACVPVCPVQAIVHHTDVALGSDVAAADALGWFLAHPGASGGATSTTFAPRADD